MRDIKTSNSLNSMEDKDLVASLAMMMARVAKYEEPKRDKHTPRSKKSKQKAKAKRRAARKSRKKKQKMRINFYKVGGCVRDELLGVRSKDIDYTVVFEDVNNMTPEDALNNLVSHLNTIGCTIHLYTPEMYTIRAKWPDGEDADFVLARKEVGYIEGTRKPKVVLGTLYDDLERRDFTVNAIAKDENGLFIDPLNGTVDLLEKKILRTPLDPWVTMMDDPLRILRALRFSLTKGLEIDPDIFDAFTQEGLLDKFIETVSQERIREELTKMFSFDTVATIKIIHVLDTLTIPGFAKALFKDGMWLMPTTKKR